MHMMYKVLSMRSKISKYDLLHRTCDVWQRCSEVKPPSGHIWLSPENQEIRHQQWEISFAKLQNYSLTVRRTTWRSQKITIKCTLYTRLEHQPGMSSGGVVVLLFVSPAATKPHPTRLKQTDTHWTWWMNEWTFTLRACSCSARTVGMKC